MANLYADEDFPRQVVEALRNLGHDVVTAHEAGQANQRIPDPDVLAFAIEIGQRGSAPSSQGAGSGILAQ